MTEIQKDVSKILQKDENKEKIVEGENKKTFKEDVIDFIKDLVIVIFIVVIIRTFLVLPFQVSGQSMYNSYYDKQFIIVDVLSYLDIPLIGKISAPKRGDVIVFRPGVNESKEYYIKRIVASQGDTLKIVGGEVFLKKDGKEEFVFLDESFLDSTNYGKTFVSANEKENVYLVPENSYFVMGDNRNGSSDSRSCFTGHCALKGHTNYITNDDIVGSVMIDLGYFNFKIFRFVHPYLGIDTTPKFFSGPDSFDYE